MNSRSLLIFLGLNKSENEFLIHAQCRPDPTGGYSPRSMAACHTRPTDKLAGPWPGGPVQPRKWLTTREQGARAGHDHRT
jgi:hypothetical protein